LNSGWTAVDARVNQALVNQVNRLAGYGVKVIRKVIDLLLSFE